MCLPATTSSILHCVTMGKGTSNVPALPLFNRPPRGVGKFLPWLPGLRLLRACCRSSNAGVTVVGESQAYQASRSLEHGQANARSPTRSALDRTPLSPRSSWRQDEESTLLQQKQQRLRCQKKGRKIHAACALLRNHKRAGEDVGCSTAPAWALSLWLHEENLIGAFQTAHD